MAEAQKFEVLHTFWDNAERFERGTIIERRPGDFTQINCAKGWLRPVAKAAAKKAEKVVEPKPKPKPRRTRGTTKNA